MMYLKNRYANDYGKTRLTLMFATVLLVLALTVQGLYGQARQRPFTLDGVVHSITKVPVMDAMILIQESTTFAVTDEFGNFTIEIPAPNTIITIEADGFLPKSVTIADGKFLEVVLDYAPEGQGLKDKVFIPWGISDKRSVTSSVSTITSAELRKSPVVNLAGAVSGRLPGYTVLQTAGSPGWENSTRRIRGVRTLESDGGWNMMSKGGVGTPIAIVDGFERSYVLLDPSEIETFSVLKDAAATAIYGVRGANGVTYITTKRGQANKRTIDLEVSTGIVTPMRLPDFLGSYDYARLYNEALANDGLPPVYTADDLEKYRTGSSPLTHPDVDAYGEFIKDFTFQRTAALTMSGGNRLVRYFVAITNNNLSSLYDRMDENPEFKCYSRVGLFNLRTNLDVTLSKRFSAQLNLGGRVQDREYPYGLDNEANIFNELANVPPNAYPISFRGIDPNLNKEIFMLGGNSMYTTNPLGRLSFRGQSERFWRVFQMGISFKHDLDFITPGLAVNFQFDADGTNYYRVSRYKAYVVWDRVVMPGGQINYVPYNEPSSLTTEVGTDVEYYNGKNLHFTYDRKFGVHKVDGFAMWRRYTTIMKQANQPDVKREDFALRMNYSFDNRYFLESTLVLTGSDNFFETNQSRFFLPAISGAWILSDEPFLKDRKAIQFLKLRASAGLTANDDYNYLDPNDLWYRFPYRERWWSSNDKTRYGTSLAYFNPIVYEGILPNPDFTVEKGRMYNFGIDTRHLGGKLIFTAEVWFEKRYDCYTRGVGSVPMTIGIREGYLPIQNRGIVFSKGFETSLGWIGSVSDFNYWVNGMVDYYTNRIENMDEPAREFPNLIQTGDPNKSLYGLIALGFFKNQEEIDNSPPQMFGPYKPGDIKFKDVNGDGVVDANDITKMGYTTFPQLSYAIDMGFDWKGIDFSVLWQGNAMRSVVLNNYAVRALTDNGKISTFALGRYTDESSWSTATYPRLTTLANDNNWRGSTFWMRNIAFLRAKNVELGYNLPMHSARKLGVYGVRVFLNGYNLFTIDNLKDFDPEDPDAGISKYPMTKIINLGFNIKF